jgi:hypothetical protein
MAALLDELWNIGAVGVNWGAVTDFGGWIRDALSQNEAIPNQHH